PAPSSATCPNLASRSHSRRAVPSPAPTFPPGWCGKGGRSQTTHRSLRSLMRPRQRSPSASAFGRNRLWFDEQRLSCSADRLPPHLSMELPISGTPPIEQAGQPRCPLVAQSGLFERARLTSALGGKAETS